MENIEAGPRFKDLGGMARVIEDLNVGACFRLFHPELTEEFERLGVLPMEGIFLHGPPGCGKTTLARAVANESGVPLHQISAAELASGVLGEAKVIIEELFSNARTTAPSIIFIDEIDAIASARENWMEQRILSLLVKSIDDLHMMSQYGGSESPNGLILVMGATNRPDAVGPALRRSGRLDNEIFLGAPNEHGRKEVLSVLTRDLSVETSVDLRKIARSTPGFVGADLAAVAEEALNLAMRRRMDEPVISMSDFEEAVKSVQPTSIREGFCSIPNVKWEDIGGLDLVKEEFERYIVGPIKNPDGYKALGVDPVMGFLLYGPPGCGKTMIAEAVAYEAGVNFFHVRGPELLNKDVGESEEAIRTLFSRARTWSPCILFFDEVDAVTSKEGGWIVARLLNQLLVELDRGKGRQGVFVIGATKRADLMDPLVLRPGRLSKLLHVGLPSADERGLILKVLARNKPIDDSVDLCALGRREACENFSGADLAAWVNKAEKAAAEEAEAEEKSASTDRTPDAHQVQPF